jgi:hypothetical protein
MNIYYCRILIYSYVECAQYNKIQITIQPILKGNDQKVEFQKIKV